MLSYLAERALRLMLISLTAAAGIVAFPVMQPNSLTIGMSVAFADDDDDDDGGDDDGRSSGRADRGSSGYRGESRPLRDVFRWPFRAERELRRAPVRRQAAVPTRVPNEIVATGLDQSAIASLQQQGFAVEDRIAVSLVGGDMVRLSIPRGLNLNAARAAVVAVSSSATVDFNHIYQPESLDQPSCVRESCGLLRHMVGWPTGGDGSGRACLKSLPIGLIDTAINADHAVFAGIKLEVLRLDEKEDGRSGEQHGTAVAALLAGTSGGRSPGLLPAAEIVAVDAFRRFRKGTDIANAFDLVRALDLLTQRDIRVINLSLTGPPNLLLEQAVEAAIDMGAILVAAAGNDGPKAKPVYPAAYDDVVAVTAVDSARKAYRRAVQGSHIDIAAPGVNVWTAASISGSRQKSGTSFAAPFVTAAVSVLLASGPNLSPAEIETALTQSAQDIGPPGKDPVYGWGLLDASILCERS
ncbi:S8 family serine peptidase [Pararhizobium arenae]|uniref:S8 family serine peptidase n=1 Tax=Pararhizobium arenae TaxID=1856850 RepID=UPI00094AC5E1|nr:S8 family serine peptidase [Pararhizobium arenae]